MNDRVRVRMVFLGTPQFAATCLESLIKDDRYNIVAVVSQPDRPAGRNMKIQASAVKTLAEKNGIQVMTPEKVSSTEVMDVIRTLGAESAVVVAYGQILSQSFLDMFPQGVVNIHGSLLPRWRGAAPIQRSIEAGDRETGVALQMLVKELDAGDVLGVRKIEITDEMDSMSLYEDLAKLGCELLCTEYMDYLEGDLAGDPQDHNLATYAKKIQKEESIIDWSLSAHQIFNKMRAFVMGPGVRSTFDGKKIKIVKAKVQEAKLESDVLSGEVVAVTAESFLIATGGGVLEVLEVQPESRRRQSVSDFLKGHRIKQGDCFGG